MEPTDQTSAPETWTGPDGSENWRADLSPRELELLSFSESYALRFAGAGAPGHNLILLLAKLAGKLDTAARK